MADMTLDEIRVLLAPVLARHAAFDGWRKEAVAMAAAEKGVDADIAALAFADGPVDMIDAWFASIDARMLDALPADTLDALSIRRTYFSGAISDTLLDQFLDSKPHPLTSSLTHREREVVQHVFRQEQGHQVGVAREVDAEHVAAFALVPIRGLPESGD